MLGHHDGIEFYTIAKRKGLGLSSPTPLYVVELDPENNRVVVGEEGLLLRDEFEVERCSWLAFERLDKPLEAAAAIRYYRRGAAATVVPGGNGRATVKLREPQRAGTPAQACVFYQDDLVVGGGWIMRD